MICEPRQMLLVGENSLVSLARVRASAQRARRAALIEIYGGRREGGREGGDRIKLAFPVSQRASLLRNISFSSPPPRFFERPECAGSRKYDILRQLDVCRIYIGTGFEVSSLRDFGY